MAFKFSRDDVLRTQLHVLHHFVRVKVLLTPQTGGSSPPAACLRKQCLRSRCNTDLGFLVFVSARLPGYKALLRLVTLCQFNFCSPPSVKMDNVTALSKSAHTALAVKACLLGGNSKTKCSMTFVNIAVAISALAGGPKNGFAPRPEYGGVFDIFRGFLGV